MLNDADSYQGGGSGGEAQVMPVPRDSRCVPRIKLIEPSQGLRGKPAGSRVSKGAWSRSKDPQPKRGAAQQSAFSKAILLAVALKTLGANLQVSCFATSCEAGARRIRESLEAMRARRRSPD